MALRRAPISQRSIQAASPRSIRRRCIEQAEHGQTTRLNLLQYYVNDAAISAAQQERLSIWRNKKIGRLARWQGIALYHISAPQFWGEPSQLRTTPIADCGDEYGLQCFYQLRPVSPGA